MSLPPEDCAHEAGKFMPFHSHTDLSYFPVFSDPVVDFVVDLDCFHGVLCLRMAGTWRLRFVSKTFFDFLL